MSLHSTMLSTRLALPPIFLTFLLALYVAFGKHHCEGIQRANQEDSCQTTTGYLPANNGAKQAFKDADIIVIPAGIPRMTAYPDDSHCLSRYSC